MKATEEHLLIFEGASAGQYPQRSCPSEQRHKNRQMTSARRVKATLAEGLKAFGFVPGVRTVLRRLRAYSPLRGCSREAATVSMRLIQRFPK